MRWRRKKDTPPTARQRLRSTESTNLRSSYAYHNRRSDLEENVGRQVDRPPVNIKQSRIWTWIRVSGFGGLVLLVVAVAALVSIISASSTPKIIAPTTKSADLLRSSSEYEAATRTILEQSVLNKNKLTINTTSVRKGLLDRFPELAEASVTLPLIAHKPVVHIVPEQPALMLTTRNGRFIVSASGKALLLSDNAPESAKLDLPVVTDQSGLEAKPNQQVLPANQVSFLTMVLAQLTAKGVRYGEIDLPTGTSELDVHINGEPYLAKFNLQRPDSARQQAGAFISTQNQLKSQNITPAQYIDVRLDGRAYYL